MFQLLTTTMGNLLRITAGILILSLCLQVSPRPTPETSSSPDYNINIMQKDIKCKSDATFYTPQNLEMECLTSALDCFMRELNGTVAAECEDPLDRLYETMEIYNPIIQRWQDEGLPKSTSSRCACEQWPEKPFDEFLTNLESLFQLKKSIEEK